MSQQCHTALPYNCTTLFLSVGPISTSEVVPPWALLNWPVKGSCAHTPVMHAPLQVCPMGRHALWASQSYTGQSRGPRAQPVSAECQVRDRCQMNISWMPDGYQIVSAGMDYNSYGLYRYDPYCYGQYSMLRWITSRNNHTHLCLPALVPALCPPCLCSLFSIASRPSISSFASHGSSLASISSVSLIVSNIE